MPNRIAIIFLRIRVGVAQSRGCDLCNNITRLSFSNYSLIDLVLVNKHSVLNACFGHSFLEELFFELLLLKEFPSINLELSIQVIKRKSMTENKRKTRQEEYQQQNTSSSHAREQLTHLLVLIKLSLKPISG